MAAPLPLEQKILNSVSTALQTALSLKSSIDQKVKAIDDRLAFIKDGLDTLVQLTNLELPQPPTAPEQPKEFDFNSEEDFL